MTILMNVLWLIFTWLVVFNIGSDILWKKTIVNRLQEIADNISDDEIRGLEANDQSVVDEVRRRIHAGATTQDYERAEIILLILDSLFVIALMCVLF